jgi:threonine dehydrogenase-like Zn-dependent dehydrogenase
MNASFSMFDLILEATGIASLEFDLIDALAINGVYAVAGIPSGDRSLNIDGAEFMRRLVLRNQVIVGSVNASRDHFQLAVNDLLHAQTRWHEHVAELITQQHSYMEFETALQHHGPDEIKVVLEWDGNQPASKGTG